MQFRFRIGTDSATGEWGWNVDNIHFTNAASAAWSTIVADRNQCVFSDMILGVTNAIVAERGNNGINNTVQLKVENPPK